MGLGSTLVNLELRVLGFTFTLGLDVVEGLVFGGCPGDDEGIDEEDRFTGVLDDVDVDRLDLVLSRLSDRPTLLPLLPSLPSSRCCCVCLTTGAARGLPRLVLVETDEDCGVEDEETDDEDDDEIEVEDEVDVVDDVEDREVDEDRDRGTLVVVLPSEEDLDEEGLRIPGDGALEGLVEFVFVDDRGVRMVAAGVRLIVGRVVELVFSLVAGLEDVVWLLSFTPFLLTGLGRLV